MRLCVSYSAAREVSNLAAEAACGKAWFMAWHCAEATVPAKAPMCDGPPLQSRMVGHLRGGAVQVPVSEPCAYLPQESLRPVARLNTGLPGVWSLRSATKQPKRSNWNFSSGCALASEGST